MKVAELMERRVATVHPADELDLAARLMLERECGSVVVVDAHDHPIAVLTDRDICMAALRTDRPLSASIVADAMSTHLFTCHADDGVDLAEGMMALHQVRRLPVVDDRGRVQGVLALDDVAREACHEEELLLPEVSCATVGRTLGQIARARMVEHPSAEDLP